ncbi:hypothetical protein FSC37_08235 [Piscinibacter aquaticus]|uniref:Cyanophycinase n=1 Tax=Piscinibacter aquaticus TaxID=392597 RepID=A0A5C6TZ05_9BURK|nr:hypothetical protein FSC37_08235 [Piscinibacter aquaticus]
MLQIEAAGGRRDELDIGGARRGDERTAARAGRLGGAGVRDRVGGTGRQGGLRVLPDRQCGRCRARRAAQPVDGAARRRTRCGRCLPVDDQPVGRWRFRRAACHRSRWLQRLRRWPGHRRFGRDAGRQVAQRGGRPFVIDRVDRAEAIFIAGGDQADYINLWKGTPLQAAIERAMARNVPIGGTSAGLAVLGQVDFAALNGTIDSARALGNPYDKRITLDQGFLTGAGLTGVIADAHLDSRDRMGRLVTFLARMVNADGWLSPAAAGGIGLDVETALVIVNGTATRLGVGSAYFLKPTMAPTVCAAKQPLTFRNVMVERLSGSGSFNLPMWRGTGTTLYDLSAENGVLYSSQPGGSVY